MEQKRRNTNYIVLYATIRLITHCKDSVVYIAACLYTPYTLVRIPNCANEFTQRVMWFILLRRSPRVFKQIYALDIRNNGLRTISGRSARSLRRIDRHWWPRIRAPRAQNGLRVYGVDLRSKYKPGLSLSRHGTHDTNIESHDNTAAMTPSYGSGHSGIGC